MSHWLLTLMMTLTCLLQIMKEDIKQLMHYWSKSYHMHTHTHTHELNMSWLYALVTHKYFLNYCTCNNLIFLSLLFIDLLSIGVIKLKRRTLVTLAHHNCPTCLVNQQEIKETKQCKDFEYYYYYSVFSKSNNYFEF